MESNTAIESVVRESYGRLVAFLAARTRDVVGAEDALSDAMLSALMTWPKSGVPANPEAWLVTTSRRKLIDSGRRRKLEMEHAFELYEQQMNRGSTSCNASPVGDERLTLLFVCAHPAIDRGIHTPLMLQTVLGIGAEKIAKAFLVSASTMSQRLVRAKAKIFDAGIAFQLPDPSSYAQRLDSVLEAIYAAYGTGWELACPVNSEHPDDLAVDAVWLARMLVDLLPDAPEARGLLSLMLFCESRRDARRCKGEFVPLSEQDTANWSVPLIREAADQLSTTAKRAQLGRFQLEAAIQSVHAERAKTGETNWGAIAMFYEQLLAISPTVGAKVGYAVAKAEHIHPNVGLAVLDQLPPKKIASYQPYWAVRAHLMQALGRDAEADQHFDQAIELTTDDAIRRFLMRKLRER